MFDIHRAVLFIDTEQRVKSSLLKSLVLPALVVTSGILLMFIHPPRWVHWIALSVMAVLLAVDFGLKGRSFVSNVRESRRLQRHVDLKYSNCGYPISSSSRCTECGELLPDFTRRDI